MLHYACNGQGQQNACSNGGFISHPQGPLPPWTLPRGPSRWVGRPLLGLQDGPGTSDWDGSCSTVFAMTMATIMHAQMGGVISHPQNPLPPWTLPRGPSRWVGRPVLGLQDGPGTSDLDGSGSTMLAMVRGSRMHAQMGGSFPIPRVPSPLGPCLEGLFGGWAGQS